MNRSEHPEWAQHTEQRPNCLNSNQQQVMQEEAYSHYVKEQRYADAVRYIERRLMEGSPLPPYVIEDIPQHYYRQSPVVMHALAQLQWHKGALHDAKLSAEHAVKGYAALYMPQQLLTSLACLGHLLLRIGQLEAAEAIAKQFVEEYEHEPAQEVAAEMLQFLAISFELLPSPPFFKRWSAAADPSSIGIQLLQDAIVRFERRNLLQEACLATVDLAWHFGMRLDQEDWTRYEYQCELWCHISPQLAPYKQLLMLLRAYHENEWTMAVRLEEILQLSDTQFPYFIDAIRASIHLYCTSQLAVTKAHHREHVQYYINTYRDDMQLQYELKLCLIFHFNCLNKEFVYIERQARTIAKWLEREHMLEQQLASIKSRKTNAISFLNSKKQINTESEAKVIHTPIMHKPWRLYMFGGLRLSREQDDKQQLAWKRKKSKELLIYLSLQPHYTAVREQIIEALQLGEEFDKAAQQLYVITHQLKRTLHQELGIEQSVLVKDGFLRLSEETIDYVDVEHYLTLIRIADQLWHKDRSLSYEMYEGAYMLYDDLLPELPYEEWLERIRANLVQKQISLLKRCILYTKKQQDWSHTEMYVRSWLELDPFHEEAHVYLIELLVQLGRPFEAKTAYEVWKQRSRDELGIEPTFTPIFEVLDQN